MECILREISEETNLSASLAKTRIRSTGELLLQTYSPLGYLSIDHEFSFDIELTCEDDVQLEPNDHEVDHFTLMNTEELIVRLGKGEFTPDAAITWVDFLLRKGIINESTEEFFDELKRRMNECRISE